MYTDKQLVKLYCRNRQCKYLNEDNTCQHSHISIAENGKCSMGEYKENQKPKHIEDNIYYMNGGYQPKSSNIAPNPPKTGSDLSWVKF